jgi:cysteine desulfurase
MTYLDHNATTPLDPRVRDAMLVCLDAGPGNPSSAHSPGRRARAALELAREQVAALVGAQPRQVVFTSGGTEANNLALHGLAAFERPGVLALSPVEHPSVIEPARALEAQGWRLDWLPVDGDGRVDVDAWQPDPETRIVSAMWANNETGVIEPVPELARKARASGAWMHCDAVQALGKLSVDVRAAGLDLVSLSSHKIYGPQGVGALIVDPAVDLAPLLRGGGQERGLRGGTENLAGIVGFGAAAALASEELASRRASAEGLVAQLVAGLQALDGVTLFAAEAPRLPNTLSFALDGLDGEALLLALDRDGLAVSSGSACHTGTGEPSHVLTAMGVPAAVARGAIRVSVGQANRVEEIDALLAALQSQAAALRRLVATA